MLFDRNDLKKALKDNIIFFDDSYNYIVDNFVLDSRDIKNNTLFVAKKGEKNDGHNFIKDILKNETAIIIAEYLPEDIKQNSRIILVKNSIRALENLANYSRNRIHGYIIGITGSVGKTSTKEIFYHCLSKIDKTHCNNKSFNSYFGVLDTLINTPSDTKFAIFEMGMSEYGEMDILRKFVKPNITVINGVLPIHLGNFKEEKDIVMEKSKINDSDVKTTILKKDNKWYDLLYKDAKDKNIKNILNFGAGGNVELIDKKINNNEAELTYLIDGEIYKSKTSNLDFNMAANFLSLLCFAKSIDLDINTILDAFYDYKTYEGRNNIEKIGNLTIINGTYNANIKSFISGLDLMKNIYQKNERKVCIFGDILELGEKSKEIHLELVEPILNNNIDIFIGVGENMKYVADSLKNKVRMTYHFDNAEELIKEYKNIIKDGDLIFIKSSRDTYLSKIITDLKK